jgi:hypothetical protein
VELPSTKRLQETFRDYVSSVRQSSDGQLLFMSFVNGVVMAVFSATILAIMVLFVIEKTTGKMGEYDGAIVAGFVFFVMASSGFVAGFSATLGVARQRFALPTIASIITLVVSTATWFATAQLAQILWLLVPLLMVGVVTLSMLPRRTH